MSHPQGCFCIVCRGLTEFELRHWLEPLGFPDFIVDGIIRLAFGAENGEQENMITLQQEANSNSRPRGGRGGKGESDFLGIQDLTRDHTDATIQGCRQEKSKKGKDYLKVKLAFRGGVKFLYLEPWMENFKTLIQAFGADENDWVGKKIVAYNNYDEFNEKYTMVVEPAKESRSAKAR
jgi:hypothetical protein